MMTVRSTNRVRQILGVAVSVACLGAAMPAMAKPFTNASLRGLYSGTLTGFLTEPFVPTWSSAFFRADGKGGITGVRATFNIGGCVILQQRGSGTYEVASTGIGRATITVRTTDAVDTEACDPSTALPVPQEAEFVFEFTINQVVPNASQTLDSLGLTFVSNDPGGIKFASGSQGTIRRQKR
jgi:hypothetical protein